MADHQPVKGNSPQQGGAVQGRVSPASADNLRRAWLGRRRKLASEAPRGTRRPPDKLLFGSAPYSRHVHPAAREDHGKYAPSGIHFLSSTNKYGLTSRSERFYPEAYKPIEDKFWREIDAAERQQLIHAQAEMLKKISFRDRDEAAASQVVADQLYEEAVGRRRQAIRRRLSFKPPKRYEERKKWEEAKRHQPLERRYVARELTQFENTAFHKAGPLDVPVLIQGVLKRLNQPLEEAPKRLKVRRPKYQQEQGVELGKATLPKLETQGAPLVGINMWNNKFGLQSSAVSKYPEAYREVSSVFWRKVSKEHSDRIALVQAQAMEKVGFERKTEKFFIEDFDPSLENRFGREHSENQPARLPSRWDSVKGGYDPANEGLSLQNRYSEEEFYSASSRVPGYGEPGRAAINLEVIMLVIAFVVLGAGMIAGMTPLIWGIVIVCLAIGAGMLVSQRIS